MTEIKGLSVEKLGSAKLYISAAHRFGTDAFLLADFAAPRHKDEVCDLCSGCGIVAVAMYERFRPREITAVEIDPEAHELLKMTVGDSGFCGFTAVCADLKDWKSDRELDLITCNPPYKRDGAGIKSRERTAIAARHEVLCSFGDVCAAAARSLKFGGRLCVCNRPERLCDMLWDMRSHGLEPKRVRFVSKNPYTQPWLVLVEAKKGGKPFLTVERGFYTQNEDGSPSPDLKNIYLSEEYL